MIKEVVATHGRLYCKNKQYITARQFKELYLHPNGYEYTNDLNKATLLVIGQGDTQEAQRLANEKGIRIVKVFDFMKGILKRS